MMVREKTNRGASLCPYGGGTTRSGHRHHDTTGKQDLGRKRRGEAEGDGVDSEGAPSFPPGPWVRR